MNAQYKRSYNRSYMILEDEGDNEGFEEKMICRNRLRSLLVLQIMASDEKRQFWYDITGRDSLKSYMDYEKLGFREMESLLEHLIYAVEETREYLLDPGHILLSAEGIFFDRNTLMPSFAYCPFEEGSFPEGLRSLFETLLKNMDHEDPEFVSVMYEIYGKILSDNFTLEEMLETLRAHDKGAGGLENNAGDSFALGPEPAFGSPPAEPASRSRKSEPFFGSPPAEPASRSRKSESFFGSPPAEPASPVSDFKEYDFEIPKAKPREKKSLFKRKKKDRIDDMVMYIGEESAPQEESHETVVLSGSFLTEPDHLKYSGSRALPDLCIDRDTVTVGSAAAVNDGVIDSPAISKRHARFTRNAGMLFLEDLNSTNGTYVNGEPLNYQEKRLLRKNDKIHFADEMFVLQ